MIEGEEQEILLNTLAETPQEEVHTIEEDIYVIGVESLNGQAGDLTLKSINGINLVGDGNIALQTPLNETQLTAVNSGIDSQKVGQIATNATHITTLQNTKQDNLTQTQLNAVNSGIDQTKVAQIETNKNNIASNTGRITTIEGKIPSTATSANQLTDKNYVDNAIATNTANYISDNGQPFQSYADLVAYSGPLTNNDYAFVETTDSAGNELYTRYKYNADQQLWAEEYTIANPYFTSDQWASINSGIASNDVTQIGTNKTDIASLQSGKQDSLTSTQLEAVDSGINATKVQQIVDNTTAIGTKQDTLVAGTNITIASDGKTISATDTTYTAGTGLTLTGTEFSVTEPVPAGFFSNTQGSQSGTGTTITLDGTADAPIDSIRYKGDAYQEAYTGKNLFNIESLAQGNVTVTDGVATGTAGQFFTEFGPNTTGVTFIDPHAQITVSATAYTDANSSTSGNGLAIRIDYTDSTYDMTLFANGATTPVRQSITSDPAKTVSKVLITYAHTSANIWHVSEVQIEKGSTATTYEKYVGGTPAPSPINPCPIQTVTGSQTISISDGDSENEAYSLTLGSIELVKIGDYQDYIWNDGGTWKKHATIGKVTLNGSETWNIATSGRYFYHAQSDATATGDNSHPGPVISDKFTSITFNAVDAGTADYGVALSRTSHRINIRHKGYSTATAFQEWLNDNNVVVYYALTTATDTAITDATLVAELEALASARTYAGQTNISATATGTDLPAILTVDVFNNNYAGLIARLEKAGA